MKRVKYMVCFFAAAALITAAAGKGTIVNNAETTTTQPVPPTELHLGRYELFSGIPSMYIGHFILLADGKYKVAFDTDENNYDVSGRYTYNKQTGTIEWISGMFKNNNWGGKLTKTAKGFHIQFNKATYGESNK